MLIGYVRPSETDPDCRRQKEQLNKVNCVTIISEQHASAKRRTELKRLLEDLQEGDVLVVERLFVLADSTRHLVELLTLITKKRAHIYFLKEGIHTKDEQIYSFVEIVHHLADFQRDVISERTKSGLARAKKKGVTAGRPRKPDENVQRAIAMYESKQFSLAEIKEKTGISKSTLYRYLES